MKKTLILLLILPFSISLWAQTPVFELVKPDNSSDINADFIQGGRYNNILKDLDSDGDLDFVQFGYIESQLNRTIVNFNDGFGNFTQDPDHQLKEIMESLGEYALVDLNNDDTLDLVYTGLGFAHTIVALGDGIGNFDDKLDVTNLPSALYGEIFPVDINLDNNTDLLITGNAIGAEHTGIYINDGNANFTEVDSANFATASSVSIIRASKPYDGGKIDIALAGNNGSWIYQYDGSGNYTLTSSSVFDGIDGFAELEFEDVNGDGIDDLFVLGRKNPGALRIPSVYLNDGSGNYSLDATNLVYTDYIISTSNKYTIFGDLTGNGVADIGVASQEDNLYIYLNDGTGSFTSPVLYTSDFDYKSYSLGDIDGDTDLDIIETIEPHDLFDPNDSNPKTAVFINDGSGTFQKLKYNYFKNLGNADVIVIDADNDGLNDVIINGMDSVELGQEVMYSNDSLFQFTTSSPFTGNGIKNSSSLVLDYNRNGLDDVLMIGNQGFIAINNGDGTFNRTSSVPFTMVSEGDIVQLDIDSDNDLDIIISGSERTDLYLNYGKSDFRKTNLELPGFSDVSMDVADINGDSIEDLLILGSSSGTPTTKLYVGDGEEGFIEHSSNLPQLTYGDAKFVDIDSDSDKDLIIAGGDYNDSIYYQQIYKNDGLGQFTLVQSLDGLANASLQELDVDLDGDYDFISTGFSDSIRISSTTLYLNNGTGYFTDSEIDLRNLQDATVVFEDLDHDYDKELLIFGEEGKDGSYHSRLYQNKTNYPVINVDKTTCQTYSFYGSELTSSGLYTETITTTEGDSRQINLDLTVLSPDSVSLIIDQKGSYTFNDELIFESGTYDAYFVNTQGCDSIVTLTLNISDYQETYEYDHVAFELVLPTGVPQIQADFQKIRYGESTIYDMDGDGDNDYLLLGETTSGQFVAVSYLNEGEGRFSRVIHDHISFDDSDGKQILLHGDVSGDGIEDLIISGERYDNSSFIKDFGTNLYLGDSEGGLTLYTDSAFPSSLYGYIDIVDLSGDGQLDILLGHFSDGATLYISDGLGSFSTMSIPDLDVNFWAWDIAVSPSYNGGVRDIVFATLDDSFNRVYKLYQFDGTDYNFVSESIFSSTEGSRAYFGDANADGAPDVFLTHNSFSNLYINDGVGNYIQSAEDFNSIMSPDAQGLFIDLNNDNAWEVILNESLDNDANDELYIFWNDGSGNFTIDNSVPIGNYSESYQIKTGDINDDNFDDLFFIGLDSGNVWHFDTFINDQSGGFEKVNYEVATSTLGGDSKFEDIDGDGFPDLLVSGSNFYLGPVTSLYMNDATGNFNPVPSHSIDSLKSSAIAFADVDNNGTNDLVISGTNSSDDIITKLYSNSAGTLTYESSISFTPLTNGSLDFINVNNDDYPDLLATGKDDSGLVQSYLYINNEGADFVTVASGIDGLYKTNVAVGDVNSDGFEDILICGLDDSNETYTRLYLSNGDSTYSLDTTTEFIEARTCALEDINGDGFKDVYLAGLGQQYTYLNDGTGQFSLKQIIDPVWQPQVVFDDVDLDGDIDFIGSGNRVSSSSGATTYLYTNDGNGNFTKSSLNPFHDVKDAAMHMSDIDGDLKNDIVISGSVGTNTNITRIYKNITIPEEVVIWSEASWSNGIGPSVADHVLIADDYSTNIEGSFDMRSVKIMEDQTLIVGSGTALDFKGNLQNEGSISVQSGGSILTYETKNVIGNPITFHRTTRYSNNSYSMVGSPVQTDSSLLGSLLGPFVYGYDESVDFQDGTSNGVNRWEDAASTVLEPGLGYAAAGQEHIQITGMPNDGDIIIDGLSRTNDVTTTSNNWGWHLISNPYPTAIDLDKFLSANTEIQGFVALWDDPNTGSRGSNGDYLIVNSLGSVGGPNGGKFHGHIGSMQGFMVQVGDGQDGDVIFTENMRVTDNNMDSTFFRTEKVSIPKLKLSIRSGEKYSEMLIGFPEDAVEGVSREYDALKIKANESFNIYSVIDDQPYAIQGTPLESEMNIPLGIDLEESQEVKFNIQLVGDLLNDFNYYLLAKNDGQIYELNEEVSLNMSSGINKAAYSLIIKEEQNSPTSTQSFVYTDNEYINIINSSDIFPQSMRLINLNGQIKLEKENMGGAINKVSCHGLKGIYLVEITTSNSKEVHKIIIR